MINMILKTVKFLIGHQYVEHVSSSFFIGQLTSE